ncbi:MAG: 8-amino-7-oxononanoate synthase [bacterium]|nr:8-amino-7-oxononanoate synthase [bacterium]
MNKLDFLDEALNIFKRKDLYRTLKTCSQFKSSKLVLDGKELINFSSNNYLGLAGDPVLKEAACNAIEKYGCSSTASRLMCGNLDINEKLEKRIADFKRTEAALTFNSGYMANIGVISALMGRQDVIFADKYNHASLVDGCILSRAKLMRYPHKDVKSLEQILKDVGKYGRRLIVTDSVFSMDGDIAPLPEIIELANKYDCMVMIDDAHATGVLGEKGRGSAEYFDIPEGAIDIHMGTLGKALGSFGAYVAGSRSLMEFLINRARSFIFTTALPPSVIGSVIAAILILEMDNTRIKTLNNNASYFRNQLRKEGFNILNTETQIIPLIVGENRKAIQFSRFLMQNGIFAVPIRPPTVPLNTARIRFSITAAHSKEELGHTIEIIKKAGKKFGIAQ